MLTIVSVDNDAVTNDVMLWIKHKSPDLEVLRINTNGLFDRKKTYALSIGEDADDDLVEGKPVNKNKT